MEMLMAVLPNTTVITGSMTVRYLSASMYCWSAVNRQPVLGAPAKVGCRGGQKGSGTAALHMEFTHSVLSTKPPSNDVSMPHTCPKGRAVAASHRVALGTAET